MDRNDEFLIVVERALDTKPIEEFFEFMIDNLEKFLSTPNTSSYYQLIRKMDIGASKRVLPKLIFAWMAFLCGDNTGLSSCFRHINELELGSCYESSFYYALKALISFSGVRDAQYKYAKLSIDVLPKGDESIYMANAKLTYGQLLASQDEYRLAADMFKESYDLFIGLNLHFPAVVALTNELLNKYKLGEFKAVIDEGQNALMMSASFKEDAEDYWNIINLPLGMCFYELNKPNLAIRYLKLAMTCIDSINMFHMHGLIELYLFKSYYIIMDKEGMKEILNKSVTDFGQMHNRFTDLLISMFTILTCESDNIEELKPDIEEIELEYMRGGQGDYFVLLETLAFLKLMGKSSILSSNDIIKILERLRFIGFIPYTQLFLVILAEVHLMEKRQGEAENCLKEAAAIYKEEGICASFLVVPMKGAELLFKIDEQLYRIVSSKTKAENLGDRDNVLSQREREVIKLIAEGKSNEEISKELFISVGTTKWHINHIFSKLEVRNRIQAVEKAKALGQIPEYKL